MIHNLRKNQKKSIKSTNTKKKETKEKKDLMSSPKNKLKKKIRSGKKVSKMLQNYTHESTNPSIIIIQRNKKKTRLKITMKSQRRRKNINTIKIKKAKRKRIRENMKEVNNLLSRNILQINRVDER